MRRLLKLLILVGVIAAVVVVARKLMGGLGPEPDADLGPKEWPSLVPDPALTDHQPTTPDQPPAELPAD
jgi:hypothetical protein